MINMRRQAEKRKIENIAEEESNILSNNNISNTNDNIKSSRNKLITGLNGLNDNNNLIQINDRRAGYPLITESERLNEPLKTNESARRPILEVPQNIIIREKLKGNDNNQNNVVNLSFKSGDWDVRNENSIRQIDIKSKSSKNKMNSGSKNNTISDFEDSFREENIPKKI